MSGKDGEFTIAAAPLDRETMRGLRDAIDEFLDEDEDEAPELEPYDNNKEGC